MSQPAAISDDIDAALLDDMFVSPDEGRRMFDEVAWEWAGMSGEEFIRRYEAGEYADMIESEDNRYVVDLVLLIPFARQKD